MKFFHAVHKAEKIGDGTVGDLVAWLTTYIDILFPENGIEYWAENQHAGSRWMRKSNPVPTEGTQQDSVHHVACYVRQGGNEGRIIEVCLYLRGDVLKSLVWIKSFGSEDECWLIARAIDAALNSIISYQEVPAIVSMGQKLPKYENWRRETNLAETVTVTATADSLRIATPSGLVLEDTSWSDQGPNAKFYVEAYFLDWQVVLKNMKARFTVCDEREAQPA